MPNFIEGYVAYMLHNLNANWALQVQSEPEQVQSRTRAELCPQVSSGSRLHLQCVQQLLIHHSLMYTVKQT